MTLKPLSELPQRQIELLVKNGDVKTPLEKVIKDIEGLCLDVIFDVSFCNKAEKPKNINNPEDALVHLSDIITKARLGISLLKLR